MLRRLFGMREPKMLREEKTQGGVRSTAQDGLPARIRTPWSRGPSPSDTGRAARAQHRGKGSGEHTPLSSAKSDDTASAPCQRGMKTVPAEGRRRNRVCWAGGRAGTCGAGCTGTEGQRENRLQAQG